MRSLFTTRCLAWGVALIAAWLPLAAVAYDPAGTDQNTSASAAALPHPLQSALSVNLDYCDEWLAGADFKSLRQTAEGLLLLTDLLSARAGDEAWQARTAELRATINALIKAAQAEDAAACKAAMAQSRQVSAAVAALPFPATPPAQLPRPSASLRSMMALLDGTHADAKKALLFDEPDNARRSAQVLAELGPLLAAYRNDARWKKWSDDFTAISQQTASDTHADARQLRTALSEIYNRCQACHDRR